MDWMKKMAGKVLGLVPCAVSCAVDMLKGVWGEVVDGHHRLSWWLLLGGAVCAGLAWPVVLGWLQETTMMAAAKGKLDKLVEKMLLLIGDSKMTISGSNVGIGIFSYL